MKERRKANEIKHRRCLFDDFRSVNHQRLRGNHQTGLAAAQELGPAYEQLFHP
jgi:hypothetical protein